MRKEEIMPKRRKPARSADYWEGGYSSGPPREVQDGIKAKSQRGTFGASWWAQRWIGVLERFGWGTRLQRGRSYARRGQVASIAIAPGQVQAKVQGTRPTPYTVTLKIAPLRDAQWEQAIDAMAGQAIFAAKLLAGEMPQDIEQAFQAAGVALLPQSSRDITASCSCPDSANPCKHIAAVYYLLGERFDEDPFLIFQLRGRSREQVLDALRARRAATSGPEDEQAMMPSEPVPALSDLLERYYQAGDDLEQVQVQLAAPPVEAAVLTRFGTAPADTDTDLRRLYRAITERTLERLFGEG
jgi:uncharacterized Zn finger protein